MCWMAGGLAGFFGLPLGGALFVLELPHRMGMQYYEGMTPVIVSSLISCVVSKGIENETIKYARKSFLSNF